MSEEWDNSAVVQKFSEILQRLKEELGAEETLLDVDDDGITWHIGMIGKIAEPSVPPPPVIPLGSRFQIGTIAVGHTYYTDRDYTLTEVPAAYVGLDMIKTPNDERHDTSGSGYMRFSMVKSGKLYVAFDARARSIPEWLQPFTATSVEIETSLMTQPALDVYVRDYVVNEIVDLGGCYGPGSSDGTRSNYIVFGDLVR